MAKLCGAFTIRPMLEWSDHLGNRRCGAIPAHVRVYVDRIGVDATAKLLLALGGATAHFARDNPQPGSKIVEAIGLKAAKALGQEFRGTNQRIPTGGTFVARYLKGQGCSVQEIARRLHRSDVTIRRYLRGEAA